MKETSPAALNQAVRHAMRAVMNGSLGGSSRQVVGAMCSGARVYVCVQAVVRSAAAGAAGRKWQACVWQTGHV